MTPLPYDGKYEAYRSANNPVIERMSEKPIPIEAIPESRSVASADDGGSEAPQSFGNNTGAAQTAPIANPSSNTNYDYANSFSNRDIESSKGADYLDRERKIRELNKKMDELNNKSDSLSRSKTPSNDLADTLENLKREKDRIRSEIESARRNSNPSSFNNDNSLPAIVDPSSNGNYATRDIARNPFPGQGNAANGSTYGTRELSSGDVGSNDAVVDSAQEGGNFKAGKSGSGGSGGGTSDGGDLGGGGTSSGIGGGGSSNSGIGQLSPKSNFYDEINGNQGKKFAIAKIFPHSVLEAENVVDSDPESLAQFVFNLGLQGKKFLSLQEVVVKDGNNNKKEFYLHRYDIVFKDKETGVDVVKKLDDKGREKLIDKILKVKMTPDEDFKNGTKDEILFEWAKKTQELFKTSEKSVEKLSQVEASDLKIMLMDQSEVLKLMDSEIDLLVVEKTKEKPVVTSEKKNEKKAKNK
jgi:hypothetical protein